MSGLRRGHTRGLGRGLPSGELYHAPLGPERICTIPNPKPFTPSTQSEARTRNAKTVNAKCYTTQGKAGNKVQLLVAARRRAALVPPSPSPSLAPFLPPSTPPSFPPSLPASSPPPSLPPWNEQNV
jgi:hypothetical protein